MSIDRRGWLSGRISLPGLCLRFRFGFGLTRAWLSSGFSHPGLRVSIDRRGWLRGRRSHPSLRVSIHRRGWHGRRGLCELGGGTRHRSLGLGLRLGLCLSLCLGTARLGRF